MAASDWFEYESLSDANDENGGTKEVIVTFLSDAVVRDEHGQITVDVQSVTRALKDKLAGVTLEPMPEKTFMRGHVIGGFNRKWGLPLPQSLAVQMGSVFVITANNLDDKSLSALVWQGIGERRAEGFGRIAVNWHTQSSFTLDEPPPRETINQPPLNDESKTLARQMTMRLLRKHLDAQITAKANEIKVHSAPPNSQISRLRNVIHAQLMKDSSLQPLADYLKDIERRTTARKHFEKASIGNQTLLLWLKEHTGYEKLDEHKNVIEPDSIRAFEILFGVSGTNYTRTIGGEQAKLNTEMSREYALRLIDAVLARAAKDNRNGDEN